MGRHALHPRRRHHHRHLRGPPHGSCLRPRRTEARQHKDKQPASGHQVLSPLLGRPEEGWLRNTRRRVDKIRVDESASQQISHNPA